MLKRRRFKPSQSLKDRLASFAKDMRAKVSLMPSPVQDDDLLRRASQADAAFHLNEWLNSPGLQPPR